MMALRMSIAEYSSIPRKERAVLVASQMLPLWMEALESHRASKKGNT